MFTPGKRVWVNVTAASVGLVTLVLAYDGGAYALLPRSLLAIGVWSAIVIATFLGVWRTHSLPRPALAAGSLLGALLVLTGLSIVWTENPERTFAEFNRVALYLGVFVVALMPRRLPTARAWSNGFAIAIVLTGLLALASRLFHDAIGAGDTTPLLSHPIGYWNGLAMLVGIGIPLLLRLAVDAEGAIRRGLAVAPFPALVATLYLTSSRGGSVTALVGAAAFVALSRRRWQASLALALAALGGAGAVAVLRGNRALVDGPFASAEAARQGVVAALAIGGLCAAAALLYAAFGRISLRARVGAPARRALVAGAAVVVLAGVGLSDPLERFDDFRAPPGDNSASAGLVESHFTSVNGSGRWQFWTAAIDAFESAPLRGRGAGSFEAWWAQERTISMFVRDAHSLYLETLAELGLAGFLLVIGIVATGVATGVRRAAREGGAASTAAALTAAFIAYAAAVSIDWMWEMTVVSVVGVACLGLLTGAATTTPSPHLVGLEVGNRRARGRRFGLGAAGLVAGWLLVCGQAIPLLTQLKIEDSQAAVARDDAAAALDDARAARGLQPWAASPYVQLALVEEQLGELDVARYWISEAIERADDDWRLWFIKARLETNAGDIDEARESLARARELNPRSQLFL